MATFSHEYICCSKQVLGFNMTTASGKKGTCALPHASQRCDIYEMTLPALPQPKVEMSESVDGK